MNRKYETLEFIYQMDTKDSAKDEIINFSKKENGRIGIVHNDKFTGHISSIEIEKKDMIERVKLILEMSTYKSGFSFIQFFIPCYPTIVETTPLKKEVKETVLKAIESVIENWPIKCL